MVVVPDYRVHTYEYAYIESTLACGWAFDSEWMFATYLTSIHLGLWPLMFDMMPVLED